MNENKAIINSLESIIDILENQYYYLKSEYDNEKTIAKKNEHANKAKLIVQNHKKVKEDLNKYKRLFITLNSTTDDKKEQIINQIEQLEEEINKKYNLKLNIQKNENNKQNERPITQTQPKSDQQVNSQKNSKLQKNKKYKVKSMISTIGSGVSFSAKSAITACLGILAISAGYASFGMFTSGLFGIVSGTATLGLGGLLAVGAIKSFVGAKSSYKNLKSNIKSLK